MAMLAEKRQKVRWVLNPRQTAWSKDSTKFGQQYMEKMGWKAGQGIGANLQGCTEHVKVSVRSDNRGVGFKDIPEDVLPHQNNYSDLLAQLATNNPPAIANADEGKSLELKSRQSRARVHYHKFTRSKDLSTYSQKDLDCILGKSTKPDQASVEDPVENEPNFIHAGNMDAYFKEKGKSIYTSLIAKEDKFKEDEEDSLYIGFGFSHAIKDEPPLYSMSSENSEVKEELNESVKKSRKKNKMNYQRLDKSNSDFLIGDCTDTVQPMENGQELHEGGKISNRKRKKAGWDVELPVNSFVQLDFRETGCQMDKEGELNQNMKMSKRKRRKVDQSVSEEVPESERICPQTYNNEVVQPIKKDEELSKGSSKKSKNKLKKNYQSVELSENENCLNEQEVNVKIKESKRKRKKGVECVEVNEEELNVKIKESKKKWKKGDECVEVHEIELHSLCTKTQPLETKEPSVNFKKSKKKGKNEVPQSESCPQTDFIETVSLQLKKEENESHVSKSKKKRKEKTLLSGDSNYLENIPIKDETGENMSSYHQHKHKKEKKKKKVKGNEMVIKLESQNSDTVEFTQKTQNITKSVRFSDPLMSVLLIPSRDHLQPKPICFDNYEQENCEISSDLKIENCNQTAKTPVNEDQCSNLKEVPSTPDVSKNIAKSYKMVVDGVTYTNGISEYKYNDRFPKRRKYPHAAVKHIPYHERENVFDQFPGSNVETLAGYGEL